MIITTGTLYKRAYKSAFMVGIILMESDGWLRFILSLVSTSTNSVDLGFKHTIASALPFP